VYLCIIVQRKQLKIVSDPVPSPLSATTWVLYPYIYIYIYIYVEKGTIMRFVLSNCLKFH